MRVPARLNLGVLLAIMCWAAPSAHAYAQFTHLELVDVLWTDTIRPLLLQRFPGASDAALTNAHAYAYGGCLIQDIGYYPLGKGFFSDLTHYVRAGDFVESLIRNATDVNEFAFGIGALSHYVGDSIGHSEAVNPATAETFPDLQSKYGNVVTFDESPIAHVRTEFGFDVAQETWERYAPKSYHKRIGFRVSRVLLYRAFYETYGIRTRGILGPARSAVSSYRWSVRKLIPLFLNAEIVILRSALPGEDPGAGRTVFLNMVARSDYARSGAPHDPPGIGAHLAAILIRVIPKIGKLKVLSVKAPSPNTEDLFLRSLNHAIARFDFLLRRLAESGPSAINLQNVDLDIGATVSPGDSKHVDATYAKLLSMLVHGKEPVNQAIRRDVLRFFASAPSLSPEMHAELEALRKGTQ